jgi:hypothetical protein
MTDNKLPTPADDEDLTAIKVIMEKNPTLRDRILIVMENWMRENPQKSGKKTNS